MQEENNDLKSRLTTSELRLVDYQDLLSSKEDQIISPQEKLVNMTTQMESQKTNF